MCRHAAMGSCMSSPEKPKGDQRPTRGRPSGLQSMPKPPRKTGAYDFGVPKPQQTSMPRQPAPLKTVYARNNYKVGSTASHNPRGRAKAPLHRIGMPQLPPKIPPPPPPKMKQPAPLRPSAAPLERHHAPPALSGRNPDGPTLRPGQKPRPALDPGVKSSFF